MKERIPHFRLFIEKENSLIGRKRTGLESDWGEWYGGRGSHLRVRLSGNRRFCGATMALVRGFSFSF